MCAAMRRILLLRKTSRLECERMRGKGLSEQALKQKLIRSGSDYEGLLSRHTRHECNVQRILKAITRRKMIVQLRDRESMTSQDVTSCDIIIAAGGDGNFLTGASHVADPDKLIVGINTDPERSQGYLCISPDADQSIEDIVDAILERRLKLMHRQRLRVCIGGRDLPLLALNEAFIGESDPTQVSYFQLSCRDQLISDKIRSSGLLVYTGSGSTSWAYNINKISTDTVKNILEYHPANDQLKVDNVTLNEITQKYNDNVVYNGDDTKLMYVIREPIINRGTYYYPYRGSCERLKVKSRSWDTKIILDGQHWYAFPNGAEASFTTPTHNSLLTATSIY